MRLVIATVLLFIFPALAPPPASQPTYTVASGKYETLVVHKGVTTVYQTEVKVSGGQGGGAVTSAKCGHNAITVPDCITGTVGGQGGSVVVSVSNSECAKSLKKCGGKITVTLANGDTFEIDVPGLFNTVIVDAASAVIADGVVAVPILARTFSPSLTQGAYDDWAAEMSLASPFRDHMQLPPSPVLLPYAVTGLVHVEVTTVDAGGNLVTSGFATLLDAAAQPTIAGEFPLLRGTGYLLIDTSTVPHGSTVVVTTSGNGLDTGKTSICIP